MQPGERFGKTAESSTSKSSTPNGSDITEAVWKQLLEAIYAGGVLESTSVRAVTKTRHGTSGGWHRGCRCTLCQGAHAATQKAFGIAWAQQRLPVEVRQRVLDGIYAGQPFCAVVRDLGLIPNQVWGLTKTDAEWSTALEEALTASRRADLRHGTNAAYVAGCVCSNCGEHQRQRMAKNRV